MIGRYFTVNMFVNNFQNFSLKHRIKKTQQGIVHKIQTCVEGEKVIKILTQNQKARPK